MTEITYDRFTDRARKVMLLASQEAQRFNHEYIIPRHVFLGLLMVDDGVAVLVLKHLGVDPLKMRLHVENLLVPGSDMLTMGKPPQNARLVKHVIEESMKEARKLNHNYVGTEHILLVLVGLMGDGEILVGTGLFGIGITLTKVRQAIMEILSSHPNRRLLHIQSASETFCVDCKWHKHVKTEVVSDHLCAALPRAETKDPVTKDTRYVIEETGGRSRNKYPECRTINTGNCNFFEEKENGTEHAAS